MECRITVLCENTVQGLGFLDQLLFLDDGPVPIEAEVDGAYQLVLPARLGKKAEDVALVDGRDGCFEVGKSCQQHSYGVRRILANLSQELGAVHTGHAHVGDDDGEWAILFGRGQPLFSAVGGVGFELAAQHSPERVKYEGLVVHEEDSVGHRLPQQCAPGTARTAQRLDSFIGTDLATDQGNPMPARMTLGGRCSGLKKTARCADE